MAYKQVCKSCNSEEVVRLRWVNVNTGEIYIEADPGIHTEWCFTCKSETQIIEVVELVKGDVMDKLTDATEGKLEEVIEFSKSIDMYNNLMTCLNNLADRVNNSTEVIIFTDFAPNSFYFQIKKEGVVTMDGGVIYHGTHDNGGDGSAPTYSVNLTPSTGWRIHT